MKKFKLIIIDARRWFDKTYGNTYHSVTVTVKHARKDDLVLRCDFAYGYDEQYLQTAHELLHQAGYFGPDTLGRSTETRRGMIVKNSM